MTHTIERKGLDTKSSQLLNFLRRYASENPEHKTPSASLMAREVDVPEFQISLLLILLENMGKIHIISRKPLRVMLVDESKPEPPTVSTASEDRYERFLNVEAMRHSLGRFIGDYEALHGRGPTLREMASHLQVSNHSWVWNAATMLARKGIVTFGEGIPTKLTEQGRQLYGFKPTEQPKQVVIVKRKETNVTKPKNDPKDRVKDVLSYIHEYQTQNGRAPMYREMATAMGFSPKSTASIERTLEIAFYRGLIEKRVHKTHGLFPITDAGLAFIDDKSTAVAPKRNYKPNRTSPTRACDRVDALGKFIYQYQQDHYGAAPKYDEMAEALGVNSSTSVSAALQLMERGGVIERRPFKSHAPFVFTDKGMAKFGPQTVEQAAEQETMEQFVEDSEAVPTPISPPVVERVDRFATMRAHIDNRIGPSAADVTTISDADLILELIDRGYIVKKDRR